MMSTGDLVPTPSPNPYSGDRCRKAADCQSIDLTVSYQGKTYTFGPSGVGVLCGELLEALGRADRQIEYPNPDAQP